MEIGHLTRSYESEAAHVVADVFSSMLRIDVQEVDAPGPPPGPVVTGTVHFTGSWMGALGLQCTPEQTFEFTRRLLGVDLPIEINEDVCDAYGELTNMVAGNLKAVLPPGVYLSMPSVVRGHDFSIQVCKTVPACRLAFLCELGVFWVTLVEFLDLPG